MSKNKNTKKKDEKYASIDSHDSLDQTGSVASSTECTGLTPMEIMSVAEAESYSDIYDVPVTKISAENYPEKS